MLLKRVHDFDTYANSSSHEAQSTNPPRKQVCNHLKSGVSFFFLHILYIYLRRKNSTIGSVRAFTWQAIILGSVFVNSPESTDAFFSRGGVLFL